MLARASVAVAACPDLEVEWAINPATPPRKINSQSREYPGKSSMQAVFRFERRSSPFCWPALAVCLSLPACFTLSLSLSTIPASVQICITIPSPTPPNRSHAQTRTCHAPLNCSFVFTVNKSSQTSLTRHTALQHECTIIPVWAARNSNISPHDGPLQLLRKDTALGPGFSSAVTPAPPWSFPLYLLGYNKHTFGVPVLLCAVDTRQAVGHPDEISGSLVGSLSKPNRKQQTPRRERGKWSGIEDSHTGPPPRHLLSNEPRPSLDKYIIVHHCGLGGQQQRQRGGKHTFSSVPLELRQSL